MCETKSFYLWVGQVLFLTGLLILLLWISLRSKSPTFIVTNLEVPVPSDPNTNSSVSNGDSNQQTVIFVLDIQNPNKYYRIYYDNINVTLTYGGDTLGGTIIDSFPQGKDKTDHYHSSVKADGRLWRLVMSGILNGTAELRVALVTKIRYQMWGKKSKHHGMKLNGRVPLGKDGKIKGKKKKIKLRKSSKK